MTHLTATTITTAIRRFLAPPVAIGRHGCKHLYGAITARPLSNRRESIFHSGVANCLEMRRTRFHYSVIGRHATDSLAFGYVAGRPLNDEVPASKSEVADPGAYAQGGDE